MLRVPAALDGEVRVLGRYEEMRMAEALRMTRERSLSTEDSLGWRNRDVKLPYLCNKLVLDLYIKCNNMVSC